MRFLTLQSADQRKKRPQRGNLTVAIRRTLEVNRVDGRPTTTWKDLPEVGQERIPAGTVDEVVVTHVKDPWNFFVVLSREANYSLKQPGWTKFFPAFRSGIEALRGLPKLLGLYHQQLSSQSRGPFGGVETETTFKRGDLVTAKLKRVNESERGGKEVQFQRGIVVATNVGDDAAPLTYHVYLLDTGLQIVTAGTCLLPLPEPFNCIGPLAVKASLFGVSPVGTHWNQRATEFFKESVSKIQSKSDSVLTVEILSRVEPEPLVPSADYPLLVNLEGRKLASFNMTNKHTKVIQELKVNYTMKLINEGLGIGWNLFPARPKLMDGSHLSDREDKLVLPRPKYSLKEAILLTPFHPRVYYPLAKEVLKREITRLLRIQKGDFVDVRGVDNRLMISINDDDPTKLEAYGTPCLIVNEKPSEEMAMVRNKASE